MQNFNYAHKNTEGGERKTPTSAFNKPKISEELSKIREQAFKEEIPVSDDETLNFLNTLCHTLKPQKILELGAAVGVSGSVMLSSTPTARLVTVERDENFCARARKTFEVMGLDSRVDLICGDAGKAIDGLEGGFDFIFMDCAKAQYIKYLPRLKQLLIKGGVLIADDVLLFGYVTGEEETPKKRKMLVEHIKEYIFAVTNDNELATSILDIGNGVAMSVKL